MDMDVQALPHPSITTTYNLDKMDSSEAVNLNDFLVQNPAPAKPSSASPAAKKQKKAAPNSNSSSNNLSPGPATTTPVPIAVGARSSANTIRLHEKYQALALDRPEFVYGGSTGLGWNVKTEFLCEVFEELGPFNSKQEAKEAVAGRVLAKIEELEANGELRKPEKGKKAKGGTQDDDDDGGVSLEKAGEEKKEPGENYIGQLLEYQHSTSAPQPTYQDYALGNRFSCVLTLPQSHSQDHKHNLSSSSSSSSSSPDTTPSLAFSSTTTLFPSKKLARQHAASLAIAHLKSSNLWPDPDSMTPNGGIRKKRKSALAPLSSPDTTSTPTSTENGPGPGPGASHTSLLPLLAQSLSLSQPKYIFTTPTPPPPSLTSSSSPSSSATATATTAGFHTVSCIFPNSSIPGVFEENEPLGEVRHVFGKKKAKEECARKVCAVLMRVKSQREGRARRAMGLDAGSEKSEGEGEGEGDVDMEGDGEGEEGGGEEEEWEDAVEML